MYIYIDIYIYIYIYIYTYTYIFNSYRNLLKCYNVEQYSTQLQNKNLSQKLKSQSSTQLTM